MHNTKKVLLGTAVLLLAGTTGLVAQDGGVTFTDIADQGGAGIDFERVPSERAQLREDLIAIGSFPSSDFFSTIRPNMSPQKGRGAPGIAILDYDNDGDLDIYATNGPGGANGLYQNQLNDGGGLTFVNQGVASGTDLTAVDSSGVCYGDLDNDGDQDLYVVSTGEANHLLQNNGDGTFTNVTAAAGVGGDGRHAVACTILDIDNDGLLDISVANSYDDWNHRLAVFIIGPTYPGMEHNYLFMNTGGLTFADVSAAAGIENVSNMSGPGLTGAAFTWAMGSADYDYDGDTDIFSMDNQGGGPTDPSENRGYIRIYNNDGAGNFTEVTQAAGTDIIGGWMGVDFGDLNCDGYLDFFATDLGFLAGSPSRWFLGGADGTFTDSGAGDLIMTPFGWGASVFDYDNDGDSDVVYHGGVDLTSIMNADNPGALLLNTGDCSGNFDYDATAILRNHTNRMVNGVAVGDLNNDGFEDMVTISSHDIAPLNFFPFVPFVVPPTGSAFDAPARFEVTFSGTFNPGFHTFVGPADANGNAIPHPNGTVTVEINSAGNGNNWLAVDTLGSINTLPNAVSNLDGIGAVVRIRTPSKGFIATRPITGGASYASQDDLTANFGLGTDKRAFVDVLWPGGNWNRLYQVRRNQTQTMPEIPCNYQADQNFFEYLTCVNDAVVGLVEAGTINGPQGFKFLGSMARAYFDYRFAS